MRKPNAWIAALGAAVAIATAARATDTTWNDGASGNTASASSWVENKVPNAKGGNKVTFNNSGDTVSYVTNNISQTFGSTYFSNVIVIRGNFEFATPVTVRSNSFYPGYGMDDATVNIVNRGNWYAHSYFWLGRGRGTTVTFTNEGGKITEIGQDKSATENVFSVAYESDSTVDFIMNGGEVAAKKGRVSIGTAAGATGRVTMNGGTLSSAEGDFFVGESGTGTLTIDGGGTVSVAGTKLLRIGNNSGGNGTLTLNNGTVACNRVWQIGWSAGSTGLVTVNGGTLSSKSSPAYVGYSGNGTLTINNGTVDVVDSTIDVASQSGSQGTINLNGGTLATRSIYGGGGTALLVFNGGTLKANDIYDNRVLIRETMTVTVAEGGGTIDSNGLDISIGAALCGNGAMKFAGGGSTTLTNGNTYAGVTAVELGTTVRVAAPAYIPGTITAAIPASAPADGVYVLATITGEGVFSSGVLAATPPADCALRLSPDGKSVLCIYGDPLNTWIGGASGSLGDNTGWSRGTVPAGGEGCIIGNATQADLTTGGTFAPASITFPAGSAAVTISGGETISGIAAITNLSAASHTINAPVYFTSGINVKQNAVAYDTIGNSHVTFAGGAYAAADKTIDTGYSIAVFGRYYFANTSAWTATEDAAGTRKAVAANSYLYVPLAGNMNNLHVGNGATIDIGKVTHSVSDNRISWRNYGEMIVTNLTFTGSGDRFVTSHQTDGIGTFKFEAVTCSMSGNWFYLGDATEAGNHVFYIGAGGMKFANASGTPCFSIGRNYAGNTETVRPWYSDFTIADRAGGDYSLVFYRNVTFCTDDENGVGRTITIDARTRGDGSSVAITVSGSGMVKVNKACYNATQPTVTVTDTATLAIKPGAGLGESAITVNSGATLEIPQSGTVTLAGNLTLANGAALAFKLDGNSETTLALASGKTLAATAKVGIKFAEGSFPEPGREYTLVSGANLADGDEAKFSLPAGDRGALSVKDGKLVYTAPSYFYIRVAEGSPSELAVPLAWIYDNTDAGDASDAAGTAAALSKDGANGIAVWKSYCLGLNPKYAASTLLCEAAAGQPSDGKVNIAAKNLNVPAGLSGVAVTAYLDRKNGDGWDLGVASAPVTSGSALLAAPAIESGTSFFA